MISNTVPMSQNFDVPAEEWVVTHNLKRNVIVNALIRIDGVLTLIAPKSVAFPDTDTVVISWSRPRTGSVTIR